MGLAIKIAREQGPAIGALIHNFSICQHGCIKLKISVANLQVFCPILVETRLKQEVEKKTSILVKRNFEKKVRAWSIPHTDKGASIK